MSVALRGCVRCTIASELISLLISYMKQINTGAILLCLWPLTTAEISLTFDFSLNFGKK